MSKKTGFEFHELTNFGKEIMQGNRDSEMELIMDELLKSFLGEAMTNTPVVTGNMRMHWYEDNLDYKVRKLKNGYSVTVYNKAKNERGYAYASDVDQGHQSYNQFGGPYVVRNSKYGANGGPVIGRFIVDKAYLATQSNLKRPVANELQKWLDRCVENAK